MSVSGFKRIAWLVVALSVTLGCSGTRKNTEYGDSGKKAESTKTTAKATKPATTTSAPSGKMADGLMWSSRAYPTGDRRTSAILVERGTPAEVAVGQPYDYVIKVTNLTNHTLEEVAVTDKADGALKISEASPRASGTKEDMKWLLGNLGPGKSKTIRVKGVAQGTGEINHCCDVRWEAVLCSTTRVVQPKLALVKTGTPAALICDPIVYKFTITNGGTGAARNAVIREKLPSGVKTLSGKSTVNIPVGTLAAGESKSFTVRCKAERTGNFDCFASATADGLSAKSGTVRTVVTQPKLSITKTGTETTFIGRQATYKISVKNEGNGIAKNCTLTDAIPAGASFVSASDGGSLRGDSVVWDFGTLNPGESRDVTLRLKAGDAMIKNTATAKAYCAEAVSATATTKVTGIPAILLEVVDVDDPIEVGSNVTYLITVTNQGSAPGNNIRITCGLEAAAGYVSSSGVTKGSHSGGKITFEPLRTLAPKKQATWRVVVNAKDEGDLRFQVSMRSDELKRPVEETEATNFYK